MIAGVKALLTRARPWSRHGHPQAAPSVLTALGLYLGAALLIGYFGVNAYTGNHGLKARQELDLQIARLIGERDALKAERSSGSGGWRCSSPTASIPTCWTSARGRCSTMSMPAT